MQKKFFCGFELAKMHCEFTYTTNAFQDESWDLSNFICYEGSRIYCSTVVNCNWEIISSSFWSNNSTDYVTTEVISIYVSTTRNIVIEV